MRKFFEHVLLALLLITSVVLGMTFWLNTKFGFNFLSAKHWQELASLQAAHTPIDKDFYVSLGAGMFILIFGLYLIFRPRFRKLPKPVATPQPAPKPILQQPVAEQKHPAPQQTVQQNQPVQNTQPEPQASDIPAAVLLNRPPKLNLPRNMETLAQNNYMKQQNTASFNNAPSQSSDKYDQEIHDIFENDGYLVKPNLTIAGLKTNLFAIGNHEVLWMGAVDCTPASLQTSVGKLKALFEETLEDIPININAFILDTRNILTPDGDIKIFHSVKEISDFMADNPADEIDEYEKENFDAYSDYIDNIISMAPHLMQ